MREAQWIWPDTRAYPQYAKGRATVFAPEAPFAVARLEKTFASAGGEARAEIEADVKYMLYVNGELAARGPAAVGGDYGNAEPLGWCFADRPVLRLRRGENKIVALVQSVPEVMADYSSGTPGFRMRLEYDGGEIVTDASWLAVPDARFAGIRDFRADAPALPAGRAEVLPREVRILEKDIPEPEYRTLDPVCTYAENGAEIYDFGKIYAGYLSLDIESDAPGEIVADAWEIKGRSMFPERIRFGAGGTHFDSFRLHSLRYLAVTGGAKVRVRLVRSLFPAPHRGSFRCSDPVLNEIWQNSAEALDLCRQSYHLDSPIHQEALGCTGDYYIESRMAYAYLGEYSLSRLDLRRTAMYLEKTGGKMFHTTYTLIWVRWLREHFRYTGDRAPLRGSLPALEAVLGRFSRFERENWLVMPDYLFVDWVPVEDFNLHHPPRPLGDGALNAFWYDALCAACEIYGFLGDAERAEQIRRQARRIAENFVRLLWREERGLFAMGTPECPADERSDWRPYDGSGKEYFGVHTNILAAAFGIAEGERAKSIVRRACEDESLIPCQPYFYHFLAQACDRAGLMEECGIPALRKLRPICAGGGLKEVFYGFDCDYSHAWGGTAVYDCAARILGVKPQAEGFAEYKVLPQLGDLEWAEGRVPAPWGYIGVRAEKKDGKTVLRTKEVRYEK